MGPETMDAVTDEVRKRVRADDPHTSLLAAERSTAFAGPHKERIAAALASGPMTAAEIGALTGLTVVQCDRRLPELQREGRTAVLQDAHGNDITRNNYRVWRLA